MMVTLVPEKRHEHMAKHSVNSNFGKRFSMKNLFGVITLAVISCFLSGCGRLGRMDIKAKVRHLLLSLAPLGLLSGCSKPNLPTKPTNHLALTATVEIEGKAYPVDFTWSEENYVKFAGGSWMTDWKSSDRAFVRILDTKFAVAVWLPSVNDADLEQFHATFALIERGNPRFLRSYPTLETGEKRDGVFQLTQLKIERSTDLFPAKPMTRDEESLKADIAARKYGYLYGMLFHKEQWSRSEDLQRLLSPLKGFTPLGKRTDGGKKGTEVWHAFATFNSRTLNEKDRYRFGFEFRGQSWTPLPYSGVYWYRERFEKESGPVWISYRGHLIDQKQHELLFDETRQELVSVWRLDLEPLEDNHR
jgi:hypothetical protein